jgi:type II secretory pathway pseudopilin PulG
VLAVLLILQLIIILFLRAGSSTAAGRHDLEAALGAREEELRAARAEILGLREALQRTGPGKSAPSALTSASSTAATASSDFYNSRRSRSIPNPGRTGPAGNASTSLPSALGVECAAAAVDTSPDGARPIAGGDLERPGVLEAAFAARSVERELIFLSVGDTRDHRRASKDPELKSIRWEPTQLQK